MKDPIKLIHSKGLSDATTKILHQKIEIDNNSVIQKCTIDYTIYEKLEIFLYSHIQLALSPILNNGRSISFAEFAIPSNGWSCIHCESVGNPEGTIKCAKCYSLRGVESFPNILYNQGKPILDELIVLN